MISFADRRLVQMDGAVDELFLNVTPLHRADPYIQRELSKLQLSVTKHPRIIRNSEFSPIVLLKCLFEEK